MNNINQQCINPVTQELRNKLVNFAISTAEEGFDIKLDFSHNSIKSVERILDVIHSDYLQNKNETGLNGIAINFAAYIVETILRNTNEGIWYSDHLEFGEKSYPLYWKGSVIFPFAWCQKRIFDGRGDDVWFKYKTIILAEIWPDQDE